MGAADAAHFPAPAFTCGRCHARSIASDNPIRQLEVSITNSMVAVAPTSLGTAIISTTKAEVVVKLLKQREPDARGWIATASESAIASVE